MESCHWSDQATSASRLLCSSCLVCIIEYSFKPSVVKLLFVSLWIYCFEFLTDIFGVTRLGLVPNNRISGYNCSKCFTGCIRSCYQTNSIKAVNINLISRVHILITVGFRFWATICKTVRPMLSVRCLSVTLVYCGQTVAWIKIKLDTEVSLDPVHIVLAPPVKRGTAPQFSAHVCCGQTAGWIKMPLGTEVGLGPDHIVLCAAELLLWNCTDCAAGFREQLQIVSEFRVVDCHTMLEDACLFSLCRFSFSLVMW